MGLQIKEILKVAENILRDAGDEDCKRDAEILLCHAMHYDARRIFMNWSREINDSYCEGFFELVQKRAGGTPTQYLTNGQDFMGHSFFVDERTLIPRMDTETVAEAIIEWLRARGTARRVLELCTGSGVVAISLAKEIADLKVTASDVDPGALEVAAINASNLGVAKRVKFVKSDIYAAFKTGFGGARFDVIAANPPYISSDALMTLQREIIEHEPLHALDGGADGLDFHRRIISGAPPRLRKNGALFLEIGYDQADRVRALIDETERFGEVSVRKDLAGNDRVLSAELK
ncbi:MAG: peptide chain release factor N(5)-glutamine methyltransferase [Clostridiales Family XIII bacterium]|jgi:release factor glutamine methyltransferase|nr:peptide chain release factor N(5)-glutamine methyltransferase [Clostridiales Family XIII bacterium]